MKTAQSIRFGPVSAKQLVIDKRFSFMLFFPLILFVLLFINKIKFLIRLFFSKGLNTGFIFVMRKKLRAGCAFV